jgi:acetyl esterase/lipase
MSVLSRPPVAALAAKTLQRLGQVARKSGRGAEAEALKRFPEYPGTTHGLAIPTALGPARAVVYLPKQDGERPPPVHVNFHGGGYVMPLTELDDALCRFLAAEAGVAVVNVDYAVAPQHPFPAPPRQAFEIVRWIAAHGAEQSWDGGRLSVGGQSAGGGLAAAVARQALEQGGPPIALQVLHYPPLDLATNIREKPSPIAKPRLRPWMGDVFDSAYVPDPRQRTDPLASPANPADTADLTGIAPALLITAEFDVLRAEGIRYADRLRAAGALLEHYDVPGVDHGYDETDGDETRQAYALIARRLRAATQ